jgi:hypothetical protein
MNTNQTLDETAQVAAGQTQDCRPTFLFLGPAKSGSTWTYNLLDHLPETFMVPGKGLYYFSSQFHRGEKWYLDFFRDSRDAKVRGEVAHNYLPCAEACERIHQLAPAVKLMVCLREPAERSFSAYLDGVKNGRYPSGLSFEDAMEQDPTIIDHSRYATHLRPYVERFDVRQIHIGMFDQLKNDPQQFADNLCDFLEIDRIELDSSLSKKMMPAGRSRYRPLTLFVKRMSKIALFFGLRRLRGRVKTSRWFRNLVYASYKSNAPQMSPETRARLYDMFREEVQWLDDRFDLKLVKQWGYAEN